MQQFDPKAYWEKRLAERTGLQGVGYMGLGQSFNAWMYRVRRNVFLRTVRKHIPDRTNTAVLDVGSGTGEYLVSWQRSGIRLLSGSDLTQTAVQRLRAAFPGVDVQQLDISEANALRTPAFDAISCMDVLFHVVDDARFEHAIANFARGLRPGGLLIISDEFVHHEAQRETHFVSRSLSDYTTALERNGFEVVDRRPMFHLLNRPSDSDSPWLHRWWSLVMRLCKVSNALGGLLAAVVFPLELLLVRTRKEGAATEILVCRKVR